MRFIFKWWIFHCYVGLPEGNPKKFNTKKLWRSQKLGGKRQDQEAHSLHHALHLLAPWVLFKDREK